MRPMIEVKRTWYRLLLPVGYLFLLFLVVLLSFSGGRVLTSSWHGLTVHTREVPGPEGLSILEEVRIDYHGLSLRFSRKTPLEASTDSGGRLPVIPLSFTASSDELTLEASEGVRIRIIPSVGDSLRIVLSAPPRMTRLTIPFSLSGGLKAQVAEDLPILALNPSGDDQYYLSLPGTSRILLEQRILEVGLSRDGNGTLTLGAPSGGKAVFAFWYRSQNRSITPRQVAAAIQQFVDSAYKGWQSRLLPDRLVWSYETERGIHEETVIAYAAEAIRRNTFPDVVDTLARMREAHPAAFTFLSNPYVGNLQRTSEAFFQELDDLLEAYLDSLSPGAPSPLHTVPDLYDLLVMSRTLGGSGRWLSRVQGLLSSLDPERLSPAQALELLRLFHRVRRSSPALLDTTPIEPLFDTVLYPALTLTDEGLFVASGGRADIRLSLAAAAILSMEGARRGDPLMEEVSRDLYVSSLKLVGPSGTLPASFPVDDPRQREGIVFPEEVYPFVMPDAPLPHIVPLLQGEDLTGWVWTILKFPRISVSETELLMEFEFPEGWIHHMVIQGVRPYTRLEILRLTWRTTPVFEIYPMGAYYTPGNETLYVKYRHREQKERILVTY